MDGVSVVGLVPRSYVKYLQLFSFLVILHVAVSPQSSIID